MYLSSAGLMLAAADAALPSKPNFWVYLVGAVAIGALVVLVGVLAAVWDVMDRSDRIARDARRFGAAAPVTVKTLRRRLVRVWIFGPLTVAVVVGLIFECNHPVRPQLRQLSREAPASRSPKRPGPLLRLWPSWPRTRTAMCVLLWLRTRRHRRLRCTFWPLTPHLRSGLRSRRIRPPTTRPWRRWPLTLMRWCGPVSERTTPAPPEILVGLAGDSEMSVRVSVIRNPSAPEDVISAAVR